METSRRAALRALLRVDSDSGFSNLVLDHTLSASNLNRLDRALATTIFYGVLERRITLDYFIGKFVRTPMEQLSPTVLEILRIGAYQLFYLEKIPPSAAVNECVNLTKECGAKKASGFVNAVLRNLLRNRAKIHMPDPKKNPLKALSVEYSCPEWLISLWQDGYGVERTRLLLQSLFIKPDVFIRVNNTRISEEQLKQRLFLEGIEAQSAGWLKNALKIRKTGEIGSLNSYQEGFFHVQDLSSQLCCFLLGPCPDERVIDVCSAPGGKTFTLAEFMENRGTLLAFDKYPSKVKLICQGAGRLKLSTVQASVRDAAAPGESMEPADRVLCDVPCSGLGILRRKPEIRYKLPSAIDSLPDLQYLILCKSSELVKNGGILFYSTCTLNPKENSGVVDRFLSSHPAFEPQELSLPRAIKRVMEEPGSQLTLMPFAHGTDGFFIAAFRKRQE